MTNSNKPRFGHKRKYPLELDNMFNRLSLLISSLLTMFTCFLLNMKENPVFAVFFFGAAVIYLRSAVALVAEFRQLGKKIAELKSKGH